MDIIKKKFNTKSEMYAVMAQHIRAIFQETFDLYAALSNTSALLALYLDNVNWTGFYIMKDLIENTKKRKESLAEEQRSSQSLNVAEDENDSQSLNVAEDENDSQSLNMPDFRKENRKKQILVLGPFQGKPAVAHIEVGSGVCGTAVESLRQQRVDDVRSCCNHIACDLATASEIVTPIFADGKVWGVIDIDSPIPGRFDAEDEEGMKVLAEVLGEMVKSEISLQKNQIFG